MVKIPRLPASVGARENVGYAVLLKVRIGVKW